MSAVAVRRVTFGSSQERKIFPYDFAPDRLGNHMKREEAPHLGPGCYDNHEFGTIIYNLQKKPESQRGYVLSARTATRFPPFKKMMTPSPQHYQQDQSQSRVSLPGRVPFSSNTQRFKKKTKAFDDTPGPGTYVQNAETNRKVVWPMCFGKPDWSKLPQQERKTVKVDLTSDKAFVKHRSRLAYLSLYY
ncbi:ciliary microtubule-associated protein 3 [Anableps anableps]